MNYSYRKFKKTDFNEIFKIFLKFQEAIKIETFYNLTKDQSDNFTNIFLMSELKKLVSKNQTYIGLCEGEIFGFACFGEIFAPPTKKFLPLQTATKDGNFPVYLVKYSRFGIVNKYKYSYEKKIYINQ